MCWKRLKEWFDSPVIKTKSWPKINATLDVKVVETMPQQTRSIIKAKSRPTKYQSVQLFLGLGSVTNTVYHSFHIVDKRRHFVHF